MIKELIEQKLISPPSWLLDNLIYLAKSGSHAYGTATPDSDIDLFGLVVPPADLVFKKDVIPGFGDQGETFHQFVSEVNNEGQKYDITIYSVIKFAELCRQGNPNIYELCWIPENCVILETPESQSFINLLRSACLCKSLYFKYCGFITNHFKQLQSKGVIGKRKELIDKFGYDTKSLTHIVRATNNLFSILTQGRVDHVTKSHSYQAIRNGIIGLDDVCKIYYNPIKKLCDGCFENPEKFGVKPLPDKSDEESIKRELFKLLNDVQ